jgi:nucleoside-diphosphate-sugar epimerase
MTELVLGGDGLIGAALVEALRARGREAVSLDIKSGCDLRLVEPERFNDCDRVWFLAWDTGGAKYIEAADRQHEMFKHNCELSARVFDALARSGKPFVYTTSQLAGLPNAYGLTKLMAERWAEQLGGKIARLWNTYGWEHPDTKSHVMTDLVLSGLVDGRVRCLTDGQERRRFIYKTDCVAAIIELFDSALPTADIAGDRWVSIREVAGEVAAQLNVETEFRDAKGSEIIVDPEKLLPDWRPTVQLSEGIATVIRDAREYLKSREVA